MEDKLRAIVAKIDAAQIPDSDKEQLYLMIQQGLEATVQPILVKYMPQTQLKDMAASPAKVTVEAYAGLIEDSVNNPAMMPEVTKAMEELLVEVDKGLAEVGIH